MHGFFGKYLDIDLQEETISDYPVPDEWIRKHLGGRGIAARILLNGLKGGEAPLGPDNIMVFGTGPFQGTRVPGAGKYLIMGKSPKTGAINESYGGGVFGHELGTSGYDGIIVRGKANKPKYIALLDGKAQICDADELWGLDTTETDRKLGQKHGDASVACIGTAGEKLVKVSCIINDRFRATARPGWGAVLGAKKLKAIVIKGSKKKSIYDFGALQKLSKEFARELLSESYIQSLSKYGTACSILPLNEMGILPTRNFKEGWFAGASNISGEKMSETILVKRTGCRSCPVMCDRLVKTEFGGQEVNEALGGPEYETIASFGSLCLNDNLHSIALANQLCNEYGMDTISTGNLIAFLMEATELGLTQRLGWEGIRWGDASNLIRLIHLIARREGIGDILAEGLPFVAEQIGGASFAVHVKGLEAAMHEPRGKKGLAISYATSPRGATHLEAMHDDMLEVPCPTPELGVDKAVNRFEFVDKPRLCKLYEDLFSFVNSLIICNFVSWDLSASEHNPFPRIRQILEAITGLNVSKEEMMLIGERNYVLRKISSARDGYSRKDDDLPRRFKEPISKGASEGQSIPDNVLQQAITEYYSLRGFDNYGPTDEKLQRLGLSEFMVKKQPHD